jgi:Ala-tRNA(Pro) deacylase
MMDIEQHLKHHKVTFRRYEHSAVFTMEQARQLELAIPGTATKNLFLRDGKGNKHWLWVGAENDVVELQQLAARVGVKRLSLASSERLAKHLDSVPGRVSILDMFQATANQVSLLVTEGVWESQWLQCHPFEHTATLTVDTEQLKPLLQGLDQEILILREDAT